MEFIFKNGGNQFYNKKLVDVKYKKGRFGISRALY